MNLTAVSKTVNEILSRNSFYDIPRNQRKYVWEKEQLSQLYEDIFINEDGVNHFMGCIVLEENSTNNRNYYNIIDGQQRLTTFNLLLLSISKIMFECNDDKKAMSNKKYIVGDIDGEEINKVRIEDSYLSIIIDGVFLKLSNDGIQEKIKYSGLKNDKYNKKVLDAYLFFYNRLMQDLENLSPTNKMKKLLELKNKILSVNVVEIIAPYDDNATVGYRIFEVLNARGIPLEQHELIKNYIFKYKKKKKNSKNDGAKKQWENIVNNLVNEYSDNMSNFFSHYIIHKYGIKSSKKGEFEAIKANCHKGEVDDLLLDLVKKSNYYSVICDPSKNSALPFLSKTVINALIFFKDMNIRQIRPVLLSLFNCADSGLISQTVLDDIIKYLESFYFIYVVLAKNKTNNLENIICNYAYKLENEFNSKVIEEFMNSLSKYKISYESFENYFCDIGYSKKNVKFKNSSNKKVVFYVLKKIEIYYNTENDYDLNKFSIEHIKCDDEENDEIAKIGNLLPLSEKRNNKISNADFDTKVEQYKKSNLLTVKRFLTNYSTKKVWDESDIINRTKKIANMCYKNVWPL